MGADGKRALICGVSGQDGAYLARLLLEKGYTVFGASRDAELSGFHNLRVLNVRDQVKTVSVALTDFRSVLQVLERTQSEEIYNLAGQSSVGLSFEQPVETFDSIGVAVLNLLEAIRFSDDARVGLAHRRLAIIDLSEAEHKCGVTLLVKTRVCQDLPLSCLRSLRNNSLNRMGVYER